MCEGYGAGSGKFRDDNVSTVTTLISLSTPSNLTFFVYLPVVLFPSLSLSSDLSLLSLSGCLFIYTWLQSKLLGP